MKAEDYNALNCHPQEGMCVQQVLVGKHWETHRSLDQRKMWITGLYLGGVGAVLANQTSPNNVVYLLLSLAGLVAFLAVLNLHYLGELHIAKAQVYVGGIRRGIIFNFNVKKPEKDHGEDKTPKACLCIRVFLCLFSLTSLYSLAIFCAMFMCGYYYFDGTWAKSNVCILLIVLLGLVVVYSLIRCFEKKLKKHARRMALYNLSEGFHDLKRPADRPPASSEN